MDVSPPDPPLMAMDLSKPYNTQNRSRSAAVDLAKKPEWYHRRPTGCGAELSSPSPSPASSYRTRASSSYAAGSTAAATGRCRDVEPGPEPLAGYMNPTLAPRLDLYRDGVHGNLWHPGFYHGEQAGSPAPESSGGEDSDSGSDVIFLVSSAKEPLLCGSFIQDGVRHMVEPLSPAVSSLDEGRSCYHLPQPLSSPSPDSSYSEDSSDSSVDIPVHHARPVVLVSDLGAMYSVPAAAAAEASSEDDSDVVEVAVSEDSPKRGGKKAEGRATPRQVRRSSRIRKSSSDTPPLGCGGTRHSLRRRAKNDAVGIYNESGDSDDLMEFMVRASSSDESPPPPKTTTVAPQRASSVSEDDAPPERPQTRSRSLYEKNVHHTQDSVPDAKKPRRTEQKPNCTRTQPKTPAAKKKPVARRRVKRRRQAATASGPFGPQEPDIDIQLRFAKPKEEKKRKAEDFCPFIRVERRTCVVVNYQEDQADASRGRLAASSLSGFVPNTSCFRLGRLAPDGQSPTSPLCCLCGYTANAMGLGDLHGPYRLTRTCTDASHGKQWQEPRHRSVISDDDGDGSPVHSDRRQEPHHRANSWSVNSLIKDSVECPADGVMSPPDSPGSPPDGSLNGAESHANGSRSPDNARSPPDATRSPPRSPPQATMHPLLKLPPHLDEWWIHEDCGIWSAGVFLVRGRLYGLEEAARLAQEAMCSCCRQPGAILGCFQKSCSRNYHYRCAIQSGCVLNEENFSMRCPEHKNKPSIKQQQR